MENDRPPKRDSLLGNPQILAAIIGGAVTIIVAIIGIVPLLVNNKPTPTPQPTVIIITATTEATQTESPSTLTPLPQVLPTDTAQVAVSVSQSSANQPVPTLTQGNILLLFDDVSFTLRNQGDQTISLEGIVFHSMSGQWEAQTWGPSVYNNLPAGECLRLRDATVGQRQPPAPCRDHIYGLQEVGASALFWIGVDSFDVMRGGEVITVCHIADASCQINI